MNEAVEGDFEAFVAARFPALRRAAFLLTGDWPLAEDLVQTALARSWPRWGRLRQDAAFEAYVRRTIATTYATWWRRRWRGEVPTEVLPEAAAGDAYAAVDDRDRVLRALATLSARSRAAVVLRYFEDMSEAEVAEVLGCSVGTVKSSVSRALTQLRATTAAASDAAAAASPAMNLKELA